MKPSTYYFLGSHVLAKIDCGQVQTEVNIHFICGGPGGVEINNICMPGVEQPRWVMAEGA